ncbi:MAG: cytochrome c nitrite reductase small subunit [Anaerolineales bacterium]
MQRLLLVIAAVAAVMSLGTFTYISGAVPMMGSSPETCATCHVMDAVYENWFHARHGNVAKCVDCHLPHDNIVNYWVVKGQTGMHDVYMFSTGQIPDAIRAKHESKEVVQGNCVRCHEKSVDAVVMGPMDNDRFCWECHRNVAHGPRGISTSPMQDSDLYPSK